MEPTGTRNFRDEEDRERAVLFLDIKAQVEAGLSAKVRPLARVIGISPANLYSMIAAGKVRGTRVSERRIVVPAHEARRLLGIEEAEAA